MGNAPFNCLVPNVRSNSVCSWTKQKAQAFQVFLFLLSLPNGNALVFYFHLSIDSRIWRNWGLNDANELFWREKSIRKNGTCVSHGSWRNSINKWIGPTSPSSVAASVGEWILIYKLISYWFIELKAWLIIINIMYCDLRSVYLVPILNRQSFIDQFIFGMIDSWVMTKICILFTSID